MAHPSPVYVYCVASQDAVLEDFKSIGIDGDGFVRVTQCGAFQAVWQHIDITEWAGDRGAANMSQLAWIGPRACYHEEIIERIMGFASVFPMTFATIFSSEEAMRKSLETRAEMFQTFLSRVSGCAEWAVKGLLDRKRLAEWLVEAASDKPTSGAQYLAQRRREREAGSLVEPWLAKVVPPLFETLSSNAVDSQVLSKPNDGNVIFHWALLVAGDSRESIRLAVNQFNDAWSQRGIELYMTGPWPPYSFRKSCALQSTG